jgi:hypothetical protein
MEINSNPKSKFVDDYTFHFVGHDVLPITIDKSIGDTIEFEPHGGIRICLVARQSITNPEEVLPAEDFGVLPSNLLWVEHKQRIQVEQTPDQKNEWTEMIEKLKKTVH